jgi:hypothetical protein
MAPVEDRLLTLTFASRPGYECTYEPSTTATAIAMSAHGVPSLESAFSVVADTCVVVVAGAVDVVAGIVDVVVGATVVGGVVVGEAAVVVV